MVENESLNLEPRSTKAGTSEEIAFRGSVQGSPGFIQSSYGNKGNFELVAPLAAGGLGYYWRNNDVEGLPWNGPTKFGLEAGLLQGTSLIQSNFGKIGNLELAALDLGNRKLMHFWYETGPNSEWHGPTSICDKTEVPAFSGNPAMIQDCFGGRGNFHLVVPRAEGGFAYFTRDNNESGLPWHGPFDFAVDAGISDAVTLIQSSLGESGRLELVASLGDQLVHFWRDARPGVEWHGPMPIGTGVVGTPSMIQSTFGNKGNFELVSPLASGGLAHWRRDNDDPYLHWHGPFMFGMNIGKVDAVSLVQSNFGDPGHLELVAQIDGQLAFFWRDSGPDFRWNGPQFITL